MQFKRLLFIEIEKLAKAPIIWVAPFVAVLYLSLMLVGFEVYAAKNGISASEAATMSNQYSGSAVVYTYAAVKHMAENMLHLSRQAKGNIQNPTARDELPVDERTITETGSKEFDFWGTLLNSLANPKPIPATPCDCPCESGKKPAAPVPPAAGESFLLNMFVGTAAAAEITPPAPPEPRPESSFMERLIQRVRWLTDSTPLEDMMIDRGRFNGLRFTYLSFYFAFIFIFPALTVAVTAQVFAMEFSRGTAKTSLLMPLERWRFFIAKMAVVAGYLFAAVSGFILLTLVVGCIFAGYGNLVLDSQLIGITGANLMIKSDGAIMLFAIAVPVAVISLLPVAAIAAWLSLIKPEPAWVISISVISYFIFYALGETPLFDDIRFLFPTTYMDGWGLLFRQPMEISALSFKLVISALITAGITIAGARKLSRLDISA